MYAVCNFSDMQFTITNSMLHLLSNDYNENKSVNKEFSNGACEYRNRSRQV